MKNRIAIIWESRGLSQEDFARRLGLTKSAISGYETGRRKPPVSIIKSICNEFSIEETWLETGEGEMEKPDANDALDDMFKLFNCNNFERSFLSAYFELSPDERSNLSFYLYKIFGIALKDLSANKLNPLAEPSYGLPEGEENTTPRDPVKEGTAETAENEYKKMISNSAPSTGSTASNTTGDTDEEKTKEA